MGTKLETWNTYLENLQKDVLKTESQIPVPEIKKCPNLADYISQYASVDVRKDIYEDLIERLTDFNQLDSIPTEPAQWQQAHQNFVEKDIKHLIQYFRRFTYSPDEIKQVQGQIKEILNRSKKTMKGKSPEVHNKIVHYFKSRGGVDLLDMFEDSQFLATFGLKILCIPISILSAYLAGYLFRKKYEHSFPSHIPSLFLYLGYYFAVFMSFLLLLFVAPTVISFTLPKFWTVGMNKVAIMDVLTCTLLHALVLGVVTMFFKNKKYFRYMVSGINTSDCLSKVAFLTSVIIYLIPFFLLYW